MEKVESVLCTLLIFVVFFAVLSAWELDESVRFSWAALFTAAFGYIFLDQARNLKNESIRLKLAHPGHC